ncbi:hypothetical protein BDQ17DRAFT_793829 [Cyathus striatus]|nr:hypothetical protein BDQ17DRAFT_793829 [Cyathus striatus]
MSSRIPRHDSIMSRLSPALLVLLSPVFPAYVHASPLPDAPPHQFTPRDDPPNSNSSVKVWVPILAIMIVLISVAVFYWTRGKGLRFFGPTSAVSGTTPLTQQSGVREITAEQLAGTINDGVSNTTSANARTRRTRRPRRTPSQISTTSLPAYNKEPGDEELVIFRGPQDMEDVTMPAATVMPPVDEDGEVSVHTGDHSQVSRYTPMPDSPHNMPLLGDDNSGDSSPATDSPPSADISGQSHGMQSDNPHETSALSRIDSNASGQEDSDPRGEAPPYFEVVDHSADNNQAMVTRRSVTANENPSATSSETTAILNATTPPTSPERVPERRSGFRNLLNRMSVNSHARGDSGHSVLTTTTSREGGTASRASHRPSLSSSSPHLTSSMFRTLSRQKSNATLASNRLNSPSLISLNSISSPLTHTTIRTEFTYPKAGPTPEQLKLISSRESFAKFGVPYGADAIAYAASASRQELPPPDFDAASSDIHLPRSAGAGPSRLRASSRAADMVNRDDDDADSSRSSSLDEVRDDERRLSSPVPDRANERGLPQADVTTSSEFSGYNESAVMRSPIEEEDEKQSDVVESTSKPSYEAPVMPPTPASAVSNDLSRKASLKISTSANTSSMETPGAKEVITESVAEEQNEHSPVLLPTPVSLEEPSKRASVATIVPAAHNRASVLPQPSQIREEDSSSVPPGLSSAEGELTLALASQQSTENLKSALPIRKPSAPPSSFQAPPSSYNAASAYSRSESRASSFSTQSFETAAETLEYSTPLAPAVQMDDADISEPGTPTVSTPRLGESRLPEQETAVAAQNATAVKA